MWLLGSQGSKHRERSVNSSYGYIFLRLVRLRSAVSEPPPAALAPTMLRPWLCTQGLLLAARVGARAPLSCQGLLLSSV